LVATSVASQSQGLPWQWTTLSALCHSTNWGAASICQTHCMPKLPVSNEIEFSIYVLHLMLLLLLGLEKCGGKDV